SLPRRRQPLPTLFPYTTLFRSQEENNPIQAACSRRPLHRSARGPARGRVQGDRGSRNLGDRRRLAEQPALAELDADPGEQASLGDRKSTRLNSSHVKISYAVFC